MITTSSVPAEPDQSEAKLKNAGENVKDAADDFREGLS